MEAQKEEALTERLEPQHQKNGSAGNTTSDGTMPHDEEPRNSNGSGTSGGNEFYENIPAELRERAQWVALRLEPSPTGGKPRKVPIVPTTTEKRPKRAKVNDSQTWGSFTKAATTVARFGLAGVGYVFAKKDPVPTGDGEEPEPGVDVEDPYTGVDLDACRDPTTGQLQPWALDVVRRFDSYTESSLNGTGVHIIAKGTLPGRGGRRGHVEMYDRKHYFVTTGEHIGGLPTEIEERQAAIDALYAEHFAHKRTKQEKEGKAKRTSAKQVTTLAEIASALQVIPAVEHDIWLHMGMAVHSVNSDEAGFTVWTQWSKTCAEKFDLADCQKRWASFKPDGGITPRSLFAAAIDRGWRSSTREEEAADPGIRSESGPRITVNNRPLWAPSDEALAALVTTNDPPFLFVRGAKLTRRVFDESQRPILESVTEPALCGFLARSADFVTRIATKEGVLTTRVPPPLAIVKDIYALGTWPQFPALAGLTECPVLRPDGTIVTDAGYDPATHLLYEPAVGLHVPVLPAMPTKADACAAAQFILTELLLDFPFCSPADTANMLAGLLTPIVRPSVQGRIPLCLLDKPAPGTGASMLSEIVSILATGEHAAMLSAPSGRDNEAEWGKRLTAILLKGSPVVMIDNVDESLQSSELSKVLTAARHEDRILGKTEMISLPVRCCFYASANNVSLRGDLARRSYRIRIDAKLERPWTRTNFRHPDLLDWVRRHRGELLAALLIMANAWFVAGQPKAATTAPTIGGFAQWTRTLSGILCYSDVPDFLQNLEALYAMVDDEGPAWGAFFTALSEHFGQHWFTVADITGAHGGALTEAIPDVVGWDAAKAASSRKRLGKALQKRLDRIYADLQLVRNKEKDALRNAVQWRIRRIGEEDSQPEPPPEDFQEELFQTR